MSTLARYKASKNFSSHCADFATLAERELAAFFHAVTELFGSEQAKMSAEDWLQELIEIDALPASPREWTLITARVSSRLARRLSSASQLTEPYLTEPQIA